jgi:hypothetical protein
VGLRQIREDRFMQLREDNGQAGTYPTWTYNARSTLLPERVPSGRAQGSVAD